MPKVAPVEDMELPSTEVPEPEKARPYVYFIALVSIMGGFLFGYDTGVVSSAMLYIPDAMELDYLWTELVVSIAVGACAVFSIVAGFSNDLLGRRTTILIAGGLFTTGAGVLAGSQNKVMLLCGRIVIGSAVGLSSASIPPYLSEVCPAHLRGLMVSIYGTVSTFGFFSASVLGAAFSYIDPVHVGWRLMMGFAAIPSILMFIGFLFLPESPRWLISNNKEERARKIVEKIYGAESKWVDFELKSMKAAREQQERDQENQGTSSWPIVQIWKTPHVRKALLVGCSLQGFQQLSGVNTLMYYTGSIIKMSGISNNTKAIWMSCAVTGVSLITKFIPIVLVEKVGRRKLLLISMIGVCLCLCFVGGSFILINKTAPVGQNYYQLSPDQATDAVIQHDQDYCKILNCDSCVTFEKCGFCYPNGNATQGYCMAIPGKGVHNGSAIGPCRNSSLIDKTSGSFTWSWNFCPTPYAWLPLIGMVCYICAFSTGLSLMPWVINAEIYPTWAKSTGTSFATATNWIMDLIITQTFLTLTELLTKYGAFFLYAGLTIVAFFVFYFTVPETKGLRVEEVETLFMSEEEAKKYKSQQNYGSV